VTPALRLPCRTAILRIGLERSRDHEHDCEIVRRLVADASTNRFLRRLSTAYGRFDRPPWPRPSGNHASGNRVADALAIAHGR
jgi:hypothetical protein